MNTQRDDAAFAILKLSYQTVGDSTVVGGLCGNAFFISPRVALTTRPALSAAEYGPAEGYGAWNYWLVSRGGTIVPLQADWLRDFPAEQTTAIVLPEALPAGGAAAVRLAHESATIGEAVLCEGHAAGEMPAVRCRWTDEGLVLESAGLVALAAEQHGIVRGRARLSVAAEGAAASTVAALRIAFLSDSPGEGSGAADLAGTPVLRVSSGEAVGMLVRAGAGGADVVAVDAAHLRRTVMHEVIRERAHNVWLERQHLPHAGDPASDWKRAKADMGFAGEVDL